MMAPPTVREAMLRRDACRSLMVSLWAVRVGLAIHRSSGWVLDRLEALSRRQRQHASDLAALGGLDPVPAPRRG